MMYAWYTFLSFLGCEEMHFPSPSTVSLLRSVYILTTNDRYVRHNNSTRHIKIGLIMPDPMQITFFL